MVRLTSQNGERPVHLLNHHHACQLMRQGERSEAPGVLAALEELFIQPGRAADGERKWPRLQQPPIQPLGQLRAAPRGAQPRQADYGGPGREFRLDQPRFIQIGFRQ
jgi:hypothetical protein